MSQRRAKPWSFKSEVELAQFVVEWLEQDGWDVYQEVQIDDSRADIVALTKESELPRKAWIIECKLSVTLKLVAQAMRWRQNAKWVSVAIPDGPKYWTDERKIAYEVLERRGIGCVPVGECGVNTDQIKNASPNIGADDYDVVMACRPEHKTRAPAGSKGGGHSTPFKETVTRLEAFVREHPGVEAKLAAKLVDHHYGGRDPAWTFRIQIERMMKKGVIRSIQGQEKGGVLCLFPVDSDTDSEGDRGDG